MGSAKEVKEYLHEAKKEDNSQEHSPRKNARRVIVNIPDNDMQYLLGDLYTCDQDNYPGNEVKCIFMSHKHES